MKSTFARSLAVNAVLLFIVTRARAGRVVEEGRAEQLWMMYPLNVLMNAITWTLLLTAVGRVVRLFRRP